ncbi:hypothetical protein C900_03009 [Fulvivirga imtechensis AK7]|uniref:Uncharacterized protein n=1 Tax=Fulvivirga imtechensis AK7 TaxID=1237149 RepID=L8JQS5_9BACT|nr:hypothetical protein [Fulvivirga imtechensis]ELR71205.1 hypothetical protein C900_03009 [Fulvivirga imtechensis AK7]
MEETKSATIEKLINEGNIIIEEKYARAYYSRSLKVVGVVWDGIFTKEQYMDFFDRLLEFGRKNQVIGFFSDIRKQGVVPVDARKYFEKHVSPEAQRLGINKTGVVSDASPFKKYYLNTIIKMTGRPAKICSDPNDALSYVLGE